MAKKVGTLIKEARTQAAMTQEALAKKVKGVSANDISLAERGEKELTQAALKEIAKATGVTQKSLLDAAKNSSGSAKKSSSSSFKVSAEEKKLIQAYRKADGKVQTTVKMLLLKEETLTSASGLATLGSAGISELLGSGDLVGSLVGSLKDLLK